MAVDLWPYSGRLAGRVTDIEHEWLWSAWSDGILPDEPTDAFEASVDAGAWTVQPGRLLIAGHLLALDALATGALPPGQDQPVLYRLVAQIDRTPNPWTYGITLASGLTGSPQPPSLIRDRNGVWQTPIATLRIAANNAVTLVSDDRQRLHTIGRLPPTVQAAQGENDWTSSESWQTGQHHCATEFHAPASGRVLVHLTARGTGANRADDTPYAQLITSYSIRAGDESGELVHDPTDMDGPTIHGAYENTATVTSLVTGLGPHRAYYIRAAHRSSVNGQGVTIRYRRLIVQPLHT